MVGEKYLWTIKWYGAQLPPFGYKKDQKRVFRRSKIEEKGWRLEEEGKEALKAETKLKKKRRAGD